MNRIRNLFNVFWSTGLVYIVWKYLGLPYAIILAMVLGVGWYREFILKNRQDTNLTTGNRAAEIMILILVGYIFFAYFLYRGQLFSINTKVLMISSVLVLFSAIFYTIMKKKKNFDQKSD